MCLGIIWKKCYCAWNSARSNLKEAEGLILKDSILDGLWYEVAEQQASEFQTTEAAVGFAGMSELKASNSCGW